MDTPIENSVDKLESYPSVTERYYTTRYCNQINDKPIEPQCVMFHSNRICLVTIADDHPVVQKKIKQINYQIGDKTNRLHNKVSGKGKKGAQILEPNSVLCEIQCDDGSTHCIYSCVKGKLVEMNDNLIERPELLQQKCDSDGFIAIILPQIARIDEWKNEMLTKEEYNKLKIVT